MARRCSDGFSGPVPNPTPQEVAEGVRDIVGAEKVFELLIALLIANNVQERRIKITLSGHVEDVNHDTGVPDLGCCLYEGACCDLTEGQCDSIGGHWIEGEHCEERTRPKSAKAVGRKPAKAGAAKGRKKAGKK